MTKKQKAAKAAQQSVPWVALVAAIAVPFFSYLESRDTARAARNKAETAQKETTAAKKTVTKVDEHTNTAFKLIVFELKRLAKDVDVCHRRQGRLRSMIKALAAKRPLTPITTAVRRPPPQMKLPANYRDAKGPPRPPGK